MDSGFTFSDEKFMRRALNLAAMGAGHVSPNPMVGAVIVAPDGRIIGEGFHRRYGGPHAEVNAFASVHDEDTRLFADSTIYVSLEPCSHYGKTPPCALLLVEKGIGRCVIATPDPNPKVSGRGCKILREAGIKVEIGLLEEEARSLNKRFMTSQIKRRPWIQLKWARSADGFIAPPADAPRVTFSTPGTLALMHRERAMTDAIMVGTQTLIADNPSLTTRLWPGNSPRPVLFATPRLLELLETRKDEFTIFRREPILLDPGLPLEENMSRLFSEFKVTSLMVEGGRQLLQSFINAGLYDEMRIETASRKLGNGLSEPDIYF